MAPHDVMMDKDGIVWFSSFGEQNLGRLDPKTGKVTEFPYPKHREHFPTGSLGLRADGAGNLWLGNMYQATIVKFDPKSEKFQFWTLPAERLMEEQGEDRIEIYRSVAQYLSTINLSATDKWKYELKTMPRPKGRATRVIYTE
jgi:streptogramin lyase